ncbi:hypothetical protein A2526_02655 [candidate division WOR-1 bacterium RIFOXYD2_FULL_36_8]|nr:MAG: hypothetical protein A2282_06795 [candidate division WOR-1 bacterium RIFOXYA12_FULL_36_13]OGC41116.1 MAG: hypothetical protein A2526_02655 [candidate division WOR-1 bacterium RIFOXYD2_FULL_36_8]
MNKLTKVLLLIILAIAILTGSYLVFVRHNIESSSKTVELVMDYDDLMVLSSIKNEEHKTVSLDNLLTEIKKRGIISIGIKEETLPQANINGEIYYVTGQGLKNNPTESPKISKLVKERKVEKEQTFLIAKNAGILNRIADNISTITDSGVGKIVSKNTLLLNQKEAALDEVGIGFSETLEKEIKEKGFRIIPRIWNDSRYTNNRIIHKVNLLKKFDTIIFDGEDIAGAPDCIVSLSKALKANNIKYGNIEIIKQEGDTKLKKLMGLDIVRVHSIPKNEIKKLTSEEAVDRMVRAVKERGVRLLYLRPFFPPELKAADPVLYNLNYISYINNKIKTSGFNIGRASAPVNFEPSGWQIILLGVGVIIGFLFLLNYFICISGWLAWIILIISVGLMPIIGMKLGDFILVKILALLSAIVFPSYAVISQFSRDQRPIDQRWGKTLLDILLIFLNVIICTVLGIILILGLLSNTVFMMGSQVFMGIKIALVLPVLITAVYFFFKTENGFDIKASKERIFNIFKASIPIWIILLGLTSLGVLFIFIARSGNFTLPVPHAEKVFRLFMEKALVIRPRTKEFLIGYPFLIVSAFLFLKGKTKWLPILLPIGIIGPVSFLNTYCHIHTPVIVSVVRSFNGIILGLVIGLSAVIVLIKSRKV